MKPAPPASCVSTTIRTCSLFGKGEQHCVVVPDQLVGLFFELAFFLLLNGRFDGEAAWNFGFEFHDAILVSFRSCLESLRASNLNGLPLDGLVLPEDLQCVSGLDLNRNDIQRQLLRPGQLIEVF